MTHQFSQVPKAEIPRSSFDRSHGIKTAFDSGLLIPILIDEALPGDTFNLKLHALSRLSTPIFPILDNLYMETFFFAVPMRLVWENWERFNGAQDDPTDGTDFVIPVMNIGAPYANETLDDYMGLPTNVTGFILSHSCLWHRAYNLIYNEWFRDQNLQNSAPINTDDGPDTSGDYKLLRRGKRHDYFTSCLPFPQKGAAVTIPLADTVPVTPTTFPASPTFQSGASQNFGSITQDAGGTPDLKSQQTDGVPNSILYWNVTDLEVDLSAVQGVTINQLRQAFQVQKILERDARGGTRYTEVIKSHFGVTSPDSRLQRPEFLGGGSTPINITPVANTVPTDLDPTTPQRARLGDRTVSAQHKLQITDLQNPSQNTVSLSDSSTYGPISLINRASTGCGLDPLGSTSTGPHSPISESNRYLTKKSSSRAAELLSMRKFLVIKNALRNTDTNNHKSPGKCGATIRKHSTPGILARTSRQPRLSMIFSSRTIPPSIASSLSLLSPNLYSMASSQCDVHARCRYTAYRA